MNPQLFKHEFNKAFTWFANESTSPGTLHLELDLYRKLWNFFLAGDSYYFVFNYHTLQCDVVSNEVEAVHGYKPSEFDLMLLAEQIHPDDFPYFLAIGSKIEKFLSQLPIEKLVKYKARFDVRYSKKNGGYIRLL
ncbi:MAG: PAS domain-containing protein, partial [Bacteroidota bacterium]|nr:PAS domain-containing protein [Bacteroidota bacterium]